MLAKYRINPGNVGFGKKKDSQFGAIIEMALRYDKPVRIGANWGSLDQSMVAIADGREPQPVPSHGRPSLSRARR